MGTALALGLGAGAAALAACAWILSARSPARDSGAARPVEPARGTAALRVAIQPETGDLVPDTSVPQPDDLGLPKPQGDLVSRALPDGALHADIRGHFTSYSLARVAPDGSIEQTCVSDRETARRLLQAPPPATPASGEEQ